MATAHATCGHEIEWGWATDGGTVFLKTYARTGEKAVSYQVVCPNCLANYKKHKLVLFTESEKNRWLGIKTKKPRSKNGRTNGHAGENGNK